MNDTSNYFSKFFLCKNKERKKKMQPRYKTKLWCVTLVPDYEKVNFFFYLCVVCLFHGHGQKELMTFRIPLLFPSMRSWNNKNVWYAQPRKLQTLVADNLYCIFVSLKSNPNKKNSSFFYVFVLWLYSFSWIFVNHH